MKNENIPFPEPDKVHPNQLPPLYVMSSVGDCLAPRHLPGDRSVISTTAPIRVGDEVVIYRHPDTIDEPDGYQALSKVVYYTPYDRMLPTDPFIFVEQYNPPLKYRIPRCNILAVHRVVGPVPASWVIDPNINLDAENLPEKWEVFGCAPEEWDTRVAKEIAAIEAAAAEQRAQRGAVIETPVVPAGDRRLPGGDWLGGPSGPTAEDATAAIEAHDRARVA